jgi:alpha-1,6-mannosyltransferase
MALPFVLLAVDCWLKREMKRFLIFSGASIIIFRSELVIFLGLLLIYDLFYKRLTLSELLKIGIPAGLGLVALTTTVDSIFWRRPLWPEAEVLWFNTILNKSSEWGTSPFLWYFYSALPRALGLSLLFVPYGLYVESRIRAVTIPALVFVFLYSFLPHKELRFIVYVFPMLNIASAVACQRLWNNRNKSFVHTMLSLIAGGHLIGNFILTVFLLAVSGTNYPGGVAMSRLHRIASGEQNITIHIDNLTAQSGVTRFTEIHANWTYSKDEHLKAGDEELHRFDYLLTEVKNKYAPEMRLLQQTHEKIELVECFSNIGVHYASLIPLKIRTKPCIMVMKRKPNAVLLKRYFDVIGDESEMSGDILENENDFDIDDIAPEEEEEEYLEPPKILRRKRLRSSFKPKSKIREIIDAEKVEVTSFEEEDENETLTSDVEDPVNVSDESLTYKELLQAEEDEDGKENNESDDDEEESVELEADEKIAIKEEISTQSGSGKIRDNIKRIISKEKTKQLIDEFKKLDLSALCDLTQMDTKECMKKLLDETVE